MIALVWPAWPFGGAVLALFGFVSWINSTSQDRRLERLAASRAQISYDQFSRLIGSDDVNPEVSYFVWANLQDYLHKPEGAVFPLHPDDDLAKTLFMDVDDIYTYLFEYAFETFELLDTDAACRANPYYDAAPPVTARTLINFLSVQPKL